MRLINLPILRGPGTSRVLRELWMAKWLPCAPIRLKLRIISCGSFQLIVRKEPLSLRNRRINWWKVSIIVIWCYWVRSARAYDWRTHNWVILNSGYIGRRYFLFKLDLFLTMFENCVQMSIFNCCTRVIYQPEIAVHLGTASFCFLKFTNSFKTCLCP